MTPEAIGQLLPLLLLAAAFYFFILRPQRQRQQAQRQLLSSLGPRDQVVTIGGFHGTVVDVDEDTLRVEIAPGTVVTLAKGAVARKVLDADTGTIDPAEPGT